MSVLTIIEADARDALQRIEAASVDLILADPPYPEIDRPYGRLSVAEWWDLMLAVCAESKRVLRPHGSAVFILQPNAEKIGQMRGWLFEFQAWACREWNIVQDVYWWNYTTLPSAFAMPQHGLLRTSVKHCVWLGAPDCYRNQDAVLWTESDRAKAERLANRANRRVGSPSGQGVNKHTVSNAALRRGGVTPFNLIPTSNGAGNGESGSYGHGAGTPKALCEWWIKYLCPVGGTVLDMFAGLGTVGYVAQQLERNAILIERDARAVKLSRERCGVPSGGRSSAR